jgi:hypothetical protein
VNFSNATKSNSTNDIFGIDATRLGLMNVLDFDPR